MNKETILGLPSTIQNSDDETMPISISWEKDTQEWCILYADEGSSVMGMGKTLNDAINKIKEQVLDIYGVNL